MSGQEHTAAFKIFHYRYYCRVRAIHLITELQLEIFGMVTTGDNRTDRSIADEWNDCQLTIAQMAELNSEGVAVRLMEPEKSVVIYDILRQHLIDHKHNVDYAVNMVKTPMEDLRKLEALAEEVYKVARMYRPVQDLGKTGVLGKLAGLGGLRPMAKPLTEAKLEEQAPQKLSEDIHAPIAQAIARQFYKRSG